MSVQFGRWNFDGRPVAPEYLDKVATMLLPYGPDSAGLHSKDGIGIFYCGFYTTKESRHEAQPLVTKGSGQVITWDGRLDNRADLINQLGGELSNDSPDVLIVAAALERWAMEAFHQFIGDWALSLWNPAKRNLTLAKDPIGTRPLYYSTEPNEIVWSSILDPLILLADKKVALNTEYIAGCLSNFPEAHLTPYVGLHSVPPSSVVRIEKRGASIVRYWDFNPGKTVRYATDAEYEEHFREVFAESVRRRLRSDKPVLAELSGGIDSSSIVCMADTIIGRKGSETPRLDTISYFDESEPNWDERPYFTLVEHKRGAIGCHVDVSAGEFLWSEHDDDRFVPTPGSRQTGLESGEHLVDCLISQQNRVLLSGLGGDEVLGGVPTPTPELGDLLLRGQVRRLAQQIIAWALVNRKPVLHLLAETLRGFLPTCLGRIPKQKRPAVWLERRFVQRHRQALHHYETRLKIFGPLPSFQENLSALNVLRRQVACFTLPRQLPYEKRYPYLDRDLLEFVYAIPREQLVRPQQRRSLMRRALAEIVPCEVLNRKRKAFVSRAPIAALSEEWPSLLVMANEMVSSALGIVDQDSFAKALRQARDGREVQIITIMRTLMIESWLRHLNKWNVVLSESTCKRTKQISNEERR